MAAPAWRGINPAPTATMTTPNPDPGEEFQDMNYQLFRTTLQPNQSPDIASMGGFVATMHPYRRIRTACQMAVNFPNCLGPLQVAHSRILAT